MTAQTAAAPHTAQRRSSTLDMGTASILTSKTAHRAHTAATEAFQWSSVSHFGVGAGHSHKCAGCHLRQARRPACPTREL